MTIIWPKHGTIALKKIKQEYEGEITALLRNLKKTELKEQLDRLGKVAESNGMTEEKFNKLLGEKG